jgi:Protein O-mannosyl-transferase TMEM260-like
LAPAIVGAVSFVVYLRTLLPGIAFGDWGEMQTVPHVLGVAHPTGYPTYILLAWLAHLVPIGSIAFRANLLSAVLVASALAVTVAILLRLGIRPLIAVGAALTLGAIPTVWAAATVAEVNPLHLLFVALLLHRALVWEEHRRTRDLLIGALLLGLALGNHLLMVFVAPFVALFVLWVGRREIASRPWMLAAAAAVGLVGLSTYLYIPLAAAQDPPLPYNHPKTLDALLWLVGGTQFRNQFGFLSSGGLNALAGSLGALWPLLATRATSVVPILGLIGLALHIRKRPAFGLMCAGILLANVYFWATYVRLEHYLLVPWLVLMIGAAFAMERLARALAARPAWFRGFDPSPLAGIAAVAFALALAVTNWQAADRSGDSSGDAFVETVFRTLPENAAILSEWDASTPLWHARYVLGHRPDVLIVDDTNIVYDGWATRERRIASLICERPVFILRLRDADLQPTRAEFRVEPFIAVDVAAGGPSAAIGRQVFRVESRDPADCGG